MFLFFLYLFIFFFLYCPLDAKFGDARRRQTRADGEHVVRTHS